jgi:chromosome partitioning protein
LYGHFGLVRLSGLGRTRGRPGAGRSSRDGVPRVSGNTYWSFNQLNQAVAGIENAWDRWYFLDENGERQLIGTLRKLPLPQPRPQCRGFLFSESCYRIIVKAQRGFAMIIGVLNQKGGADKTTIAVNLAAVYARVGHKVLLVDADPQGSALAWSSAREADPIFTIVGMAKPTFHRDLPELAAKYDVVVIDGAPRTSGLGRAAILASDLVMIPVQPSPYDVWATAESVRPITEAQQFKTDPKAVFVIKRKIVNTAIGPDVTDALAQYGFPISKASLRQRVAYAESAVNGLSVIEADPDSEASREMGRKPVRLCEGTRNV